MAPSQVTEDYYTILEVDQKALDEDIKRSYRRLALLLHPDRNKRPDATKSFQLLGRAYETLSDPCKRRSYDLIYPSIRRSQPNSKPEQTSRPPPTSTPHFETLNDEAEISKLQKSKQEREARWQTRKVAHESSTFELRRNIARLEHEIRNLGSIAVAELAEDANRNSWTSWFLSPILKQAALSEDEKARKDIARQERKLKQYNKERKVDSQRATLRREEETFRQDAAERTAADAAVEDKIRALQVKIRQRQTMARGKEEMAKREAEAKRWQHQEQERKQRQQAEREQAEKLWKQREEERKQREQAERDAAAKVEKEQGERREKQQREAAEALRKQQAAEAKHYAEAKATAKKYQDDLARKYPQYYSTARDPFSAEAEERTSKPEASRASGSRCAHIGWWSKVQGCRECPECDEVWTYLLQCPSCSMLACPKCQCGLRGKTWR